MAAPSVALFGPLDTLVGPYIEYVLLALVLVNLVTRKVQHDAHRRAAANGADAVSRHPGHVASTVLLLLASFYYLTLHQHAGMVFGALVLGVFFSDFFEFEARNVEVRNDMELDRPNSAIVASAVALLYAAYVSLFFLVADYWELVV